MQTIQLNNGVEMPVLGYGVFSRQTGEAVSACSAQSGNPRVYVKK